MTSSKELGRDLKCPILGKSLFIGLAVRLARERNVTNCWVCGCPQECRRASGGDEFSAWRLLQWTHSNREGRWLTPKSDPNLRSGRSP